MFKTIFIAKCVTLLSIACATGTHNNPTPNLIGPIWQIEDINGTGIVDRSKTFIHFNTDGQVSGIAGCNRYTATYTTEEHDTLDLGAIAVTRKACIPALNDQERKFLTILDAVQTYNFDHTGALILKTGDEETLTARQTDNLPGADSE